MKVFKATHAELDALLTGWARQALVYCPATETSPERDEECGPGWTRLPDNGCLDLPSGPSRTSVKTFLFPQPETMQTCSLRADDPARGVMRETSASNAKQIVVGVRPCDGRSVVLNNLPFREDPFYQHNLARTVLVGFTCSTPCSTCFCDQVGGSPMGTDGLDVAVSASDGGWLVEVLSVRANELFAGATLAPATPEDLASLAERRAQSPPEGNAKRDALAARDLNRLYEAPLWQVLGEACINCGACTFLCPTCYCFDIQDEVSRGQGRRIRYWDSCMFPLYSLHTSGHNPRGKKMQRTRNRFLHKLKYFPDRFGPFSCVGCGRCIQDCPVNIDIREVIHDLLTVE
ncbi:MAG: 4Fe-4S dicluster domain-containing protein [Thermodesulfobacteriota bacterium]